LLLKFSATVSILGGSFSMSRQTASNLITASDFLQTLVFYGIVFIFKHMVRIKSRSTSYAAP
jgi:hypothetical protein